MQQVVQLYINDELIDLSDADPIALTFQINNLADVQNQQGNTSNQFPIPLTQRNRMILGFPDDLTLTTDQPYESYSAKLNIAGVEVIPSGLAEINKVEDNFAYVTVLSGNVDFFDSLGGQLYDMGDSTSQWSNYGQTLVWNEYSLPYPNDPENVANCIWDVSHVANSQQKTDGWIWPVVDYGALAPYDPNSSARINVRQQRPGFFLHTAIELLVKSTGYRIDYEKSSLMRDPLYQKLIVQFSNGSFQHGSDFQNQTPVGGFTTTLGVAKQVNPGSIASGNIQFNPVTLVPDGYNYTATGNITGKVTLMFDFYLYGYIYGKNPSQVTIGINARNPDSSNYNVGSSVISFGSNGEAATLVNGTDGSTREAYQTFHNIKISADGLALTAGMQLNINFTTQNSAHTTWKMFAGASWTFEPDEVDVLYGQEIQCERIFPDISQKDLLKDTLQHFAILCQSDNVTKKVQFFSFKDIVANIPNALDWSDKCVDMGKQTTFQLGNYSQVNWMRYQFDDNADLKKLIPEYFADDKILVKDKTLTPATPVQDLFTSNFSPSPNRAFFGGTIAQILMIDQTTSPTDFSIGVEPRLLVDQKYTLKQSADGTGEKVVFSDSDTADSSDITISDVISVPYFYKPDGTYNLCYCDKGALPGLRTKYYPEVERILKRSKMVVRYFNLTPQDIQDLDFLYPIYLRQDNAYFYLNKVDSWVYGSPVKCELIRIYD